MKKILLTFSIFLAAMLVSTTIAYAGRATSTNYKVITGNSSSKGFAQSTNYKTYTMTGQPGPVGVATSSNFKVKAGVVRTFFPPPPIVILKPDLSGDGKVRGNDILVAINNYFTEGTQNWNPAADLDGDDRGRGNDILLAVNNYFIDYWPPVNSSTQPVTVPIGKTLTFYVLAFPDIDQVMPTLSISQGPVGPSFTVGQITGSLRGPRIRGKFDWTPSSATATTTLVFQASYAGNLSLVSTPIYIRAQ